MSNKGSNHTNCFIISHRYVQMAHASLTLFVLTLSGLTAAEAAPIPITLGQASSFSVLAGSTVTNTGNTFVYGNVGVSPGSAIVGFLPGAIIGGTTHSNDTLAQQAQLSLTEAYNVLASETFTPAQNLTGNDLGGLTLSSGVYHFDTSAQLTGSLILDAQGDSNARFDFQIGSTLITASASSVTLLNGANAENVYWQVGSSATLGTDTVFKGNIIALTSITMTTGASNTDGRLLARNGAVTLNTNRVGTPSNITAVPEANTFALFLPALALVGAIALHRRTMA